jgi:2-polyprenyl-3-methyl-5-hydroxy-6-metoxy-1,4-benzoquinol methylase
MSASETVFRREPMASLDLPGGRVPVFSGQDRYVENYRRIAADHVQHMQRTGHNPFITEELWQAIEATTASLVEKYAQPGARVLDVGCGLGRLLGRFAALERHGMDLSPDYLAHAQRKGIRVCLARVEDMPYRSRYFDLVVCTDVLEHVLDLDEACRRLLDVVRDDGILIVRVPYRENLALYRAPDTPYEFAHLRAFDEHSLALLFEKIHGCRVLEMLHGPYDLRHSTFKGWRLGVRGLGFAVRQVARAARAFGERAQRAVVEWALEPLEINVVVKVQRS